MYSWLSLRMNRLSNILCPYRFITPKVQHREYSSSTPTQRFPCLVRRAGDWRLCRSTFPSFLYRCDLFSTTAVVQQPQKEAESSEGPQPAKRKKTRSPAAKNSLRRVAVEAQRSRDGIMIGGMPGLEDRLNTKVALGLSRIKWNGADQAVELVDYFSILYRRAV